jgi:hypothetical protein
VYTLGAGFDPPGRSTEPTRSEVGVADESAAGLSLIREFQFLREKRIKYTIYLTKKFEINVARINTLLFNKQT